MEEKVAWLSRIKMVAGGNMPLSNPSGDLGENSSAFTSKNDIVAVWDRVRMELQIAPINPQNSGSFRSNPPNTEVSI
ncbi:hypothetical protein GA0061102_1003201 [Rhizobium miluonense]|uniref:Uncharacterized protein n=1 Tax=Rhizobium miluonense TaxID=411945 RepID=A0A1C3UG36_9HYPH|nr:hypothetical protein GA0061102_1003201 [Rhizobium miluonense]